MSKTFRKPTRYRYLFRQTLIETEKLGLNSVWIVVVISAFMGGILTLQMSYNLTNPLMPIYLIGLGTRDTLILEFSSTVMSLILAGKVGANIASEIGSMRISDQIDSMKIMGVNPPEILILPKIIAMVIMLPILYTISVSMGIIGGAIAGPISGVVSLTDYIDGIRFMFVTKYVSFSIIKSLVFGFIISSVASFYGYYASGGALEVGKASTDSVVTSSILILFSDLIITQLFFK